MSATAKITDDRCARERLIEAHLPLVRSLACRYARHGEQLEDLVQVGAIGLIKAVDRYDPGRGPLAAYAVPTVLGEIRRHLRDAARPVRLPRSRWEAGDPLPFATLGDADGELPDTEAEQRLERGEDRALLAAGLRRLARREREIVRLRYYDGLSQRRIAARLGLSQVHVSRLLAQSLTALQREVGADDS